MRILTRGSSSEIDAAFSQYHIPYLITRLMANVYFSSARGERESDAAHLVNDNLTFMAFGVTNY